MRMSIATAAAVAWLFLLKMVTDQACLFWIVQQRVKMTTIARASCTCGVNASVFCALNVQSTNAKLEEVARRVTSSTLLLLLARKLFGQNLLHVLVASIAESDTRVDRRAL